MALNIEQWLSPISPEAPCGADLSFSSEFDRLRELRREDDPTLDQGEWVSTLKKADWPGVQALCEEVLSLRSKDLRVAGWWTESALRQRGLGGLADGLERYAALLGAHWSGLHPLADDGDQEPRIGAIEWLMNLVLGSVRRVVLLRDGDARYTQVEIEAARLRGADDGQHPNGDDVQRALNKVSRSDMADTLAQAKRLLPAWQAFEQAVDAQLGSDGPGFAATRDAVAAAVAFVERLAREVGVGEAPDTAAQAAGTEEGEAAATAEASSARGPIRSRAQALAQLREVADYFRRTEPHSPVAYLAERAASWGEMPLHQWLRAVMKDGGSLGQLEDLLGVAPDQSR